MISTTAPSGEVRDVALVRAGSPGSERALPVTMPSSSVRDELTRRHARDVGRVAHLLVVLDVVVGVGAVALHAVVMHAPVAAVVVAGMHEAGHELDGVMVAGAEEHAEAPEDLEAHAVVLDHVELRPVVGGRHLGPAIAVGGSIQMCSVAARSGSSISARSSAKRRLRR